MLGDLRFRKSPAAKSPPMLPLSPAQIPRLFNEARALEAAGQLDKARAQYASILNADARMAPALFQIAQIDFKRGQHDSALGYLDRALALRPDQQPIWGLYARILEKLGDKGRIAAFLDRARRAKLPPKFLLAMQDALTGKAARSRTGIGNAPPDRIRKAIAQLQSGDAAGALKIAESLRREHPDVAIIADILASAQSALGLNDAAEDNFRAATTLDPDYAEAHANYGRFLIERARPDEAAAQLKSALRIAPKLTRAWAALGLAHARAGRKGDAASAFRKALAQDPAQPEALLEFARLRLTERVPDEAADLARRALRAGAPRLDTRLCLARALADSAREAEALDELAAILAEYPDCGPAFAARGAVLQTLGRFDEARTDFLAAIALMPRSGETYRVFLMTEKLAPDDPLIAQMQAVFVDPDLADADRASLGFALSKALEDTGAHDKVFTYLRPANDLVRKRFPYDIAERRARMDAIRTACAGAGFQARAVPGTSDAAPIFVTGLPRSGTTLVEQIIASHSRVTGGGELGFGASELDGLMRRQGDPGGALRSWSCLADKEIAAAGRRVEDRIKARFPDADLVTDKSVQSYQLIGPIRAALPNARIVVVHRDPRDNLLSIYKNMFAEGMHLYSYDLRDLAEYWHLFRGIVDFWRNETPGWFHEIHYEDLIADPETQSRALIDAVGLDWQDSCLNFHQNRRRVDTLSVHQVRQPIYRSSMRAWERHVGDLQDLLDALGGDYANGKD